jgi:hypothetical protein
MCPIKLEDMHRIHAALLGSAAYAVIPSGELDPRVDIMRAELVVAAKSSLGSRAILVLHSSS